MCVVTLHSGNYAETLDVKSGFLHGKVEKRYLYWLARGIYGI